MNEDHVVLEEEENGDLLEYRKTRIESGLLRQRIERIQDVTKFMNDSLVSLSCDLNTTSVDPLLKRELRELRQRYSENREKLEEAYNTIDELTRVCDKKDDKAIQADDQSAIEHIHILQEQVIEARGREADYGSVIKDLRTRARELELANEKLRNASPDHSLESLQSELAEVKMRENESNRLLNETRQKIRALREDWELYISKRPVNKDGPITCTEIEEEIMGACIREADAMAELKASRHSVMELETRNHVLANQIRRQDEEYKQLQLQDDNWPKRETELKCDIKEIHHKIHDAEARYKEEALLGRIKEAEMQETIADLKHKISEMESDFYEKWMQHELNKDNAQNELDETDEFEASQLIQASVLDDKMTMPPEKATHESDKPNMVLKPRAEATAGGCNATITAFSLLNNDTHVSA